MLKKDLDIYDLLFDIHIHNNKKPLNVMDLIIQRNRMQFSDWEMTSEKK